MTRTSSSEPGAAGLDLRQIRLSNAYEVRDWCKRFGCSKEELHDAVKAVGTSAYRVREHLDR